MTTYLNVQDIASIPTQYNGTLFRSRLEARWAVFFDLMRIKWEYEPQCFEQDDGDCVIQYLPDFYLTELECWVEVKATQNNLNADWDRKMRSILDYFPSPIYETLDASWRGFIILGSIPMGDQTPYSFPCFTFIQHHKGLYKTKCSFHPGWKELPPDLFMIKTVFPHKFLCDNEYPELEHKWVSYVEPSNESSFFCDVVKSAFDSARKWNFDKESN